MDHNFIKKIRWPLGCLLFFLSCTAEPEYKDLVVTTEDSLLKEQKVQTAFKHIGLISKKIQNGDLITRTGNDFTSESLRSLNQRDKTYSHCGIASIENDSLFIYHALGGEWNPDQKLLRQSITQFAEPYSNRGIGIYRFAITSDEKDSIMEAVKKHYTQGRMFDMDFDLKTDDHMYCAEFVAKSVTSGTKNKISFPHSNINRFEFIGVDDIFLHPLCKRVEQLVYK